jgi:hypothetical protein
MFALLRVGVRHALFVACLVVVAIPHLAQAQSDPLPSWNEGNVKKSITDFVARVMTQGGTDFVPVEQRIATFDNDGTLWTEQPFYFQLAFAFDRIKAMAPQHPEWKTTQPFKAILDKDMKALAASGEKGPLQIVAATHISVTTDEFSKVVVDWTANAPRFNRPYTQLVDGSTVYKLTVKDVPAEAFWSVSLYNAVGYFEKNSHNAYAVNNIPAQKSAEGSIAIQFGGCDGKIPDCLPITKGWK